MLPPDHGPPEPTTCHVCRRVAVEGAIFEAAVHDGKSEGICPECRSLRQREDGFRNLKLYLFLAGLIGALAFMRDAPDPGTWRLFNLCAGVIMLYFVSVPAKLVHALVSARLGWKSGAVDIGHGRPLFYGRLAGWALVWRTIPLGAVLAPGPLERPVPLLRQIVDLAVEPVTHLLMAAIAWLVIGAPGVDSRVFSHRLECTWLFIAANLLHFAGFLSCVVFGSRSRPALQQVSAPARQWPARFYPVTLTAAVLLLIPLFYSFYRFGSDALASWLWFYGFMACCGLAGWLSTLRKNTGNQVQPRRFGSVFQQVCFAAEVEIGQEIERTNGTQGDHPIREFARADDPEAAKSVIESFRTAHPDSFLTAYMVYFLCRRKGDWRAAQSELESALSGQLPPHLHALLLCSWADAAARSGNLDPSALREQLVIFTSPPFSPLIRCAALASAAHFLLAAGNPEALAEAAQWADEAMYLAPGDTAVSCTAGGLLVATGEVNAGQAILQEVLTRSPETENLGIAFYFLALAAKRRGEVRRARTLAHRSRVLLPENSLFRPGLQREFPR